MRGHSRNVLQSNVVLFLGFRAVAAPVEKETSPPSHPNTTTPHSTSSRPASILAPHSLPSIHNDDRELVGLSIEPYRSSTNILPARAPLPSHTPAISNRLALPWITRSSSVSISGHPNEINEIRMDIASLQFAHEVLNQRLNCSVSSLTTNA
ncbi:hypothetical protein CRG98_008947 [Punica granatum]|uniref:Uncharacterized protein n=1 Tax=Punica granatum TaxID=22663 RepID=A0A2I0KQD5_PUNGR|nr:hypothetical protein CRG98_008947 [Punica granatum]